MARTLPVALLDRIQRQAGVLRREDLIEGVGPSALEWRVRCGRWQIPHRGVVVTHSGPLSREQELWVDVLAAGPGAVLAGLTAVQVAGLVGFEDREDRRWVLVPHGRKVTHRRKGLIVLSSSRLAGTARTPRTGPPRVTVARAVIDAGSWARSDRHAEALLLAAVQQRLVSPQALAGELSGCCNLRRRTLLTWVVAAAADGAETLSEAEFGRLCRRAGLPPPTRQARRTDVMGRSRWLDCLWPAYGLVVEIDGQGHRDPGQWQDDLRRDAELVASGLRVLRFDNAALRDDPAGVAALVRRALELGGWRAAA